MQWYLRHALRRKLDSFFGLFSCDLDGIVHATIVKFFFSVHAATIEQLDGVHGYLLTIADNILRRHWRYAKPLVHICSAAEGGEITNIDAAGYCFPSAELTAMHREMQRGVS